MYRSTFSKNIKEPYRFYLKAKRNILHRRLGVPWIKTRETDCFIASWPRSGNTWLRNLVFRAMNPGMNVSHALLDAKIPEVDHLDFQAKVKALGDENPRVIKTHEPYRREFGLGRCVYIVRDGRDAMLSWYHFRQSFGQTNLNFSDFMRRCLRGSITYGSWQSHVESWLAPEVSNEVFVVKYEDLLKDTQETLKKVLSHFQIEVENNHLELAVQNSTVTQVNGQFQNWAKEKGEVFTGGLGGGSGRFKSVFSSSDLILFEKTASTALKLAEYNDK